MEQIRREQEIKWFTKILKSEKMRLIHFPKGIEEVRDAVKGIPGISLTELTGGGVILQNMGDTDHKYDGCLGDMSD